MQSRTDESDRKIVKQNGRHKLNLKVVSAEKLPVLTSCANMRVSKKSKDLFYCSLVSTVPVR